jgi:hypothetical protein
MKRSGEVLSYDRRSPLVKAGRVFQKYYGYFGFLDYLARFPLLLKKSRETPLVCIVAPPRSGSTLTYQLLASSIQGFYLTNLWNLAYATPALGGMVSKSMCKGHQSDFKSRHGFVPGMCGEAEGLRFWSYWSGQGLTEEPEALRPVKLKRLKKIVDKIGGRDDAFVCGYLGHAFCMDLLRETFPGIIFVHLKRDLLSNAYSLFRLSQNGWFSLRPDACRGVSYGSPHDQVVSQIFAIHETILRQSKKEDTIQIDYGEVCRNPGAVVEKVCAFAGSKGLRLKIQHDPASRFQESVTDSALNQDTRMLDALIRTKLAENGKDSAFFQSIGPRE